MGILKPVTDGDWVELNAPPTAHSSLPASLDRSDVPLGPALESVPMTETDPVTGRSSKRVFQDEMRPIFSPAAALIEAELDLPWLPARMGGAGAGNLARCGSVGSRLNNRPWQTCHLMRCHIESGPPYGGCSSVG